VASALAAESAPAFCDVELPPETYAAALLHDVGKLVLARYLEADVLKVLALARQQGHFSSMKAESEILGVHHGELGGLIAQHWNLPERLVVGIIQHHTPDDAGDAIADAVHVANIAAKHVGAGHIAVEEDRQVSQAALERLKMSQAGFDGLCQQVAKRLERVLAQYGA
jgi:HD-like signal output (HDOD) protein